ncbi:MAG: putative Ni-containing superoxide dismutase [Candidatus Parcubacteria bacterium]|jgi:nickel superoxide dismutase
MVRHIVSLFAHFLPAEVVHAHCDVPCGIYDPKPAQIAAATVKKMVEKITTPPVMDQSDPASVRNYHNNMTRFVLTKEEHARKCKEELLILWTDYFKPEHLTQFPNLHETFWKAAKLCSKNKQEVSLESSEQLVAAVDEIAQIFEQSKKVTK